MNDHEEIIVWLRWIFGTISFFGSAILTSLFLAKRRETDIQKTIKKVDEQIGGAIKKLGEK